MRKIVLSIFMFALFVCCVLGYFYIKKQSNVTQTNILSCVANNAAAYIRLNKPHQIYKSDDNEANTFSLFYNNDEILKTIVPQLIPDVADTSFIVRRNSVCILSAIFENDKKTFDFVHFIPVKNDINVEDILQKTAKSIDNTSNIKCYEINGTQFYIYNFKSAVAVSTSQIAIANNIKQTNEKKTINNDELFVDAIRSAGRYVDANIFINSLHLPYIAESVVGIDIAEANKSFLQNFARWFILDIEVGKNLCNLNGFIYSNNKNYLNTLKSQTSGELQTLKRLPAESSIAYSMQINNIDSLVNSYNQFYSDSINEYSAKLVQISDSLYIDAVDFVKSIYPEEITLAFDAKRGWLTIIKVANAENALDEIKKLESDLSVADVIAPLFGKIFELNKGKHIKVIDDYIVISSTDNVDLSGGILSTNTDYIVDKSQAAFYATPSGIAKILGKDGQKNKNLFKNIFVQIVSSERNFYVNANILLSPNKSEKKQVASNIENKKTEAEQQSSETPTKTTNDNIVKKQNIKSKQDLLFVQHGDNSIELKDSKGKSLWTKKINELVESKISVINPLNKGKDYLLFNTENKIYLIGVDGTAMSGFPATLPTSASNAVMACSYDKNNDYRIFIACANKKIYLYGLNGKAIGGWKNPKTESTVQRPIQFFRLGGKDYLVASDNNRVYIFNRKGDERVKVKNTVKVPTGNEFRGLENPTRIQTTNKSGQQIIINLINGKVSTK